MFMQNESKESTCLDDELLFSTKCLCLSESGVWANLLRTSIAQRPSEINTMHSVLLFN